MEGFVLDQQTGCLSVTGEFTVYQAMAAHKLLCESLNTGTLQVLDLSGVTEFDCAGLQLLLSLKKSAETRSVDMRADGGPVREVLEMLQLDTQLLQAEESGP